MTEPALKVTPHPMLPWPFSDRELLAAESDAELRKLILDYFNDREERIRRAELDPFNYAFEPEIWSVVDRLLSESRAVLSAGANRTSKSHHAANRIMHTAVTYGKSVFICLAEGERQAIATMHAMLWEYFPPELKKLNGKRDPRHVFKINWSQAGGFTEGKVVLPNRSEIYLATYNMDPANYEGWEFGSKEAPILAAWADESLPLAWLQMLERRLKFRFAKLLWTFTPVSGMTASIKWFRGGKERILSSKPAELLPSARIPGIPVGHMPYIVDPQQEGRRIIYFHLGANPFGNYTQQVRDLCAGKTTEYIERIAYGYARELRGRAFPKFGPWNVVPVASLPVVRTNYQFMDPAGNRNWALLWVGVTPDKPSRFYIYRDWPDCKTYGEWAVEPQREVKADSPRGWDGDQGPAQISLGLGTVAYKNLFLKLETIGDNESDPHRRYLAVDRPNSDGEPIRETIFGRYIDSRAFETPQESELGQTTIATLFYQVQKGKHGEVLAPGMPVCAASGQDIDKGVLTIVNDLMDWNMEQPFDPVMNAPRLYVSAECEQVIWALSNYTGLGQTRGACKDFVDLVRYMALANLYHVAPSQLKTRPGFSY